MPRGEPLLLHVGSWGYDDLAWGHGRGKIVELLREALGRGTSLRHRPNSANWVAEEIINAVTFGEDRCAWLIAAEATVRVASC